jgi:hypothetical protein
MAEHQRLAEQQAKELREQQPQEYSDDEDESDVESDIKTAQLKLHRSNDSDMEVDELEEEDVKKPMWKTIGEAEPTSSKRASDTRSVRSYRRRKYVSITKKFGRVFVFASQTFFTFLTSENSILSKFRTSDIN